MKNPIKQIVRFNQEANLLENGYNDFLEASYQIEEALEGFQLDVLHKLFLTEDSPLANAKDLSRKIMRHTSGNFMGDVDRLDKACDAVVFAVGSMAKLGLDSSQITRALNTVMRANFTKLGAPKDSYGKQTKPTNFVGPEAELQKILDER